MYAKLWQICSRVVADDTVINSHAGLLFPTKTIKKCSFQCIVLLLKGVHPCMQPVNRTLVGSSQGRDSKSMVMAPKMVDTGSVPMAGVVDVVIVLIEEPNDPDVEEE